MASSIVTTGIDATYPVAGQDNDSQGFRDNFSQIKTQLGTASSEYAVRTTADCTSETADIGSMLVNDSCGVNQVVFAEAPQDGATIIIRLKPTTFGSLVVTTFDTSTTTWDSNGTRFIGEPVTFDRKANPKQQLMFPKSANTDQITHVSKHRELVRTV